MQHVDEGVMHAYLDGALAPDERAVVDAHVHECDACRAALAHQAQLRDAASAILARAQPRRIEQPAFASVRKRSDRTSALPRWAWAATIVIALGGVTYALTQSGPESMAVHDAARPARAPMEAAAQLPDTQPSPPPQVALQRADARDERRAGAVAGALRDTMQVAAADAVAAEAPIAAAGAAARAAEPEAVAPAAPPPPAAPLPAPAAAPARAEADLAARVLTRDVAERVLGARLALVPGLAVHHIDMADENSVRVTQSLPDGAQFTLVQRRARESFAQQRRESATASKAVQNTALVRRIGDVDVTIDATVSPDSAAALLAKAVQ